jgi:folate-binding Fe-S cluster repair protein YgfZ
MIRKLIVTVFAFLSAVPAFPHTSQLPVAQPRSALHLMNDSEFAIFLKHLDTYMLRSQAQLKKMDVKSLSLDAQESNELDRSYNRCLQSLDNARDEIQKLSQKQTLKLDLFLLIDLNELARNLDALDQGLVNPVTVGEGSGAQKSLAYAREVLGIDMALAADISTFQHHYLAFTGVIDASLAQADHDSSPPPTQK